MKIVYLTNILNHYQAALGKAFDNQENVDFKFISTSNLSEERRQLGIPDFNHSFDWCICAVDSNEEKNKAINEFLNADVGIVGAIDPNYKKIILKRLKSGKLTFFAQERIYKKEPKKWEMPLRWFLYKFRHSVYKNKYILCASAYTSFDYSRTHNFKNKCFKWGYFPEFINNDNLQGAGKNKKIKIVWSARYLDWKHPEAMIYLGKYLKEKGYDFEINMIGTGELLEETKQAILLNNLNDVVHILGSMPPEKVRKYMEDADIFSFTSDRGEGWGVVLNEAMNSKCAPVGSYAIGSVPYLINDGLNGLIFKDNDWDDLCNKVEYLINNREKLMSISYAAYDTIKNEWNPQIAAKNFVELAKNLLNNTTFDIKSGPCSISKNLRDNWYK